jgi:NADH-quinone oxidoreductase subunit F
MGSHKSKKLGVPGEEVEGVVHGINFLKAYNYDGKQLARGRVGVIGGGNSALDAARVAFRQPEVKGVTIFYRRTRDEMPAYREEIEAALEEGIKVVELVAPLDVTAKAGKLSGVRFIKNALGERDASGRAKPVPVPGSEHLVELDTVIVAISEEPDTHGVGAVSCSKWGGVQVNPESLATDVPGVFAGGDVVSGPATIIQAVAAGKSAAVMIERYLAGKQLKVLPKVKLPTVYVEPLRVDEAEGDDMAARVRVPHLEVPRRKGNFNEVEQCVSEQAAVCEARRCLRCDLDFTRPN